MAEMNRRSFLAAAAGMVAMTRLTSAKPQDDNGAAPKPAPRRELRKALKYGMIAPAPGNSEPTVRDKFMLARDAGFDGIELDSPNDLQADEVLAARDASGLVIPSVVDSVHWQFTLSDSDPAVRQRGRKGLETALRDCKTYGGTSVLLVPAVVNKHVSYADAYARSQAEIRTVLPLAKELGIKIAIENVWNNFLLSPLEAARYVDELGDDAVAWHFDIGNIINDGWPEQWIRILGPRIHKLDVKEFSRTKRDDEGLWKGFDVELMEGDNNWPQVMKAVDDIHYTGWASAEVPGGDARRLRYIAERMDRIFAL